MPRTPPRKKQPVVKQSGIRIQKVMAAAGIGSRRACEALIEEGRVMVNGEPIRVMPVMINPDRDRISIDGEPLERYMPKVLRQAHAIGPSAGTAVYVMLYKPRHTITAASDPDGRRTVTELVEHPSGLRLYPVGRLDYDTMGLVLLTNDGELANQLTHPKFGVEKTYRAVVKGQLTPDAIKKISQGAYLADRRDGETIGASRTKGVDIRIVKSEPTRTIIDITLKEGRNRQVRRLLAKVGCPVRKLVRIAMGPISLKGLKIGQWRDLDYNEVVQLRRSATGRGPKGVDDRARLRSHAMTIGRATAERPFIEDEEDLLAIEPFAPQRPAASPRPVSPRPAAPKPAAAPSTPRPAFNRAGRPVPSKSARPTARPAPSSSARSTGPKPAPKSPAKPGARKPAPAPPKPSYGKKPPSSTRVDPRATSKSPPIKPKKSGGPPAPAPKKKSRFPLAEPPPRLRT